MSIDTSPIGSEHAVDREAAAGERDRTSPSEREALLRAIVETSPDGLITIDEHCLIESFSPAAERMFGYPAPEVIGRNVACLMPAPYREEHDAYVARYLRTGEKRIIGIGREVLGQRKDGSIFPLELAVAEVKAVGRRIFAGFVRDVSAPSSACASCRRSSSMSRASPPWVRWPRRWRTSSTSRSPRS